jgi:hypothetical protein
LELDLFLAWFSEVKRVMTKAERLEFMLRRFKKPGNRFPAKVKPPPVTPKGFFSFNPCGVYQRLGEPRTKWAKMADGKPALHLAHERKARVSPLTKISGHAKAKRCYPEDKGDGWEIMTVLEIPPVVSAETAVKVAIASRSQQM